MAPRHVRRAVVLAPMLRVNVPISITFVSRVDLDATTCTVMVEVAPFPTLKMVPVTVMSPPSSTSISSALAEPEIRPAATPLSAPVMWLYMSTASSTT